jgi:hypothetical protein
MKPFFGAGKWFWQLQPKPAASEEWDFTEEGKRTVRSAEFSQIIYDMLASDIAIGMTKERLWFNFVHTVAWVASGHNFERSITPEDLKALMQWTNSHPNEWRPIVAELWVTCPLNHADRIISLLAEPAALEPNENPKSNAGTPGNVAA